MSVEVVCADVFEADLPLHEARLVYADPPYTLENEHGYGTWPDPELLVARMLELGARDAAYVLHTGYPNLEELLPVISRLAPNRQRYYAGQKLYKVLAWVKPWRRNGRYKNIAWYGMWEPIVLFFGADYRGPLGLGEADWCCALRDERSPNGHATQKPEEVHDWLFERLLAGAEGRLAIDLYAGTGGAAINASRRGLDAVAVERDAFFCDKIRENMQLPAGVPGYLLAVQVNGHGRPVWPTLGRLEPEPDLLDDLQPGKVSFMPREEPVRGR